MRGADRTVLIALPVLALVAAFWFLVLSPKREEAAKLSADVAELETEVGDAEEAIELGEQARQHFPNDYRKVVKLGKAVPESDDTPSLFAQLSGISGNAGVEFRSLALSETAAATASATPPPAPPAPGGEAPPEGEAPAEGAAPASTAAPATEATAANLPIGSTVGPAGLPILPYELEFQGDFFGVADFMAGLDDTVSTEDGRVGVDGRLLTIDGFSLSRDTENGFPSLLATFAVTTYVTPSTEGLTAGATPAGPAPAPAGTPAPVSTPAPGTAPPTTGTTP